MTKNNSRRNNVSAREIAELRSEVAELRSIIASHTDCLNITAEALTTLHSIVTSPSAQETSEKQKSAPEKQKSSKLRWSDLSRDGKKSWNAYAFRSKTYGRSKEAWERWSIDRLTMEFPRDRV